MENRISQRTEIGDDLAQPAEQAEVPEIAGVTVRVVEIGEAATQVDTQAATKIDVRRLNFYYGAKQALYDVTLPPKRARACLSYRRAGEVSRSAFRQGGMRNAKRRGVSGSSKFLVNRLELRGDLPLF